MTLEDAKEALENLRRNGQSDEDILKVLYLMYTDGTIRLEDLRTFTALLGYEFTDEFEAMSDDDKKTNGLKIDENFFDKASLPEAAEAFAAMAKISVRAAKKLLNDGLKEGLPFKETVGQYFANKRK